MKILAWDMMLKHSFRNTQSVIQGLNNDDDWYMHNDACYISYRQSFVDV